MSDISSPANCLIDPRKIKLQRSSATTAVSPPVTPCVTGTAPHTSTSALALDDAKPLDPESFPNTPRLHRGVVPSTIPNVKHLLNEYGVTVRYDVIKKRTSIRLPHHSGTSDNADNVALTQILSLATLNGMSTGPIPAIVEVIGDSNQYNRVADWITSKAWDGTDRLDALCETLVHREDFPSPLKKAAAAQMAYKRSCCSAEAKRILFAGNFDASRPAVDWQDKLDSLFDSGPRTP